MRPSFRVRQNFTPKRIYVCSGCGVWHRVKPKQCSCGRMDFDYFVSETEAARWAQLILLAKLGKIAELRRQVRYPLKAAGPVGPVQVAVYVADFVYRRDGALVIEDVKAKRKGVAVADDSSKLKLKWMEAMGLPVTIVTPR